VEAFAAKAKAALTKSKSETEDGHYARLLMLLRQDKARPRKRKGLEGRLKSWFPALTAQESLRNVVTSVRRVAALRVPRSAKLKLPPELAGGAETVPIFWPFRTV
jgi:hypothetical protein